MSESAPHRKRVHHFEEARHFHELTFSCYRRLPLLTNDTWRSMLSESIDRAMQGHLYALIAFVYMPSICTYWSILNTRLRELINC